MSNERTAILTDSSASIPADFAREHGVYVMPMSVIDSNGNILASGRDIDSSDMENRLRSGETFTTAAVAPGDMIGTINDAVNDGYDQAIVVTTSSGLSTTNATACMLAGELAETDKIQLDVIDSLSIGAATGLIAMEAVALEEDGLEFARIANRMTGAVSQTKVWFAMKTLEWLRRGGRIDEMTYRLGSFLDIKPIITCDANGKYVVGRRSRGWNKVVPAQRQLAEDMAMKFHNVRLAISMTKSMEDEANGLLDTVTKTLTDAGIVIDDILKTAFPPELLVHTGPDALGIAVQGTTL